MGKFITLTLKPNGQPILVNVDRIESVHQDYTLKTETTYIECDGGSLDVQESVESVANLIRGAEKTDNDCLYLLCQRCRKEQAFSIRAMEEMGYTRYSYCGNCLQEGLRALRKRDANEGRPEPYKEGYNG